MSAAPTPSPAAAPAAAVVAGAAAARRRRLRRWVVIALALLAAIVAVALWRARPVAVAAVQLARAPLVQTLQFSGRVATRSRADVGSTLTGRIEAVLVREGDRVAAGAQIGTVGANAHADGPQLHFELRRNRQPIDPLRHLPPQ